MRQLPLKVAVTTFDVRAMLAIVQLEILGHGDRRTRHNPHHARRRKDLVPAETCRRVPPAPGPEYACRFDPKRLHMLLPPSPMMSMLSGTTSVVPNFRVPLYFDLRYVTVSIRPALRRSPDNIRYRRTAAHHA